MFVENIEAIKKCFSEFKGSGMYILLFLLSIIYIYLKDDSKKKTLFVYYPILVFLITLNPLFNKLVGGVFKSSIYWRFFWLLPLGITISYTMVKIINENEKKVFLTCAFIIVIMISGKLIYNNTNYIKTGNAYKLPDEPVLIAQIIASDEEEYKKAIVPQTVVPYIRQIDSSIDLAYKRNPEGYKENQYVFALTVGDVGVLAELAKKSESNYIVIGKNVPINIEFYHFGFEKLNETENYIIYKKTS